MSFEDRHFKLQQEVKRLKKSRLRLKASRTYKLGQAVEAFEANPELTFSIFNNGAPFETVRVCLSPGGEKQHNEMAFPRYFWDLISAAEALCPEGADEV